MASYKENLTYGASARIFARAHELRHTMTGAEKILWKEIRNRKLDGYKFRRQHPTGQFIADFYCHEAKLIIEVDGGIHTQPEVKERDENRTHILQKLGLKVLRFNNEDIHLNITNVLIEITKHLATPPSPKLATPLSPKSTTRPSPKLAHLPSPKGEGPGMR